MAAAALEADAWAVAVTEGEAHMGAEVRRVVAEVPLVAGGMAMVAASAGCTDWGRRARETVVVALVA